VFHCQFILLMAFERYVRLFYGVFLLKLYVKVINRVGHVLFISALHVLTGFAMSSLVYLDVHASFVLPPCRSISRFSKLT
jgi:hypothetical protein